MDRHEDIQLKALETLSHEDLNSYIEHVKNSPWRQKYHIESVFGALNAPAAIFYDAAGGFYHLFYTWLPLLDEDEQYWYHVTSKNLAVFDNAGVKLKPDTLFDSGGLSAGSAVHINEENHLFYVGRADTRGKSTYKVLAAVMDPDYKLKKHTVPLVEGFEPYYRQMKDPAMVVSEGRYYMLIGTETRDGRGRIAVFGADESSTFNHMGDLDTGFDEFGWLWEYPGHFTADGRDVLVFCPQGVDRYGDFFRNNYQAGYMIGSINFEDAVMTHGEFREFDAGFDFYAPRIFTDKAGRRVMIGTLGMPTTTYPDEHFHVRHTLSVPRILEAEGDVLRQMPHPDLRELRADEVTALGYFKHYNKRMRDFYGDAYELIVDFNEYDASEIYLHLRVGKRDETRLIYEVKEQKFTLDTSFSGEQPEGVEEFDRSVRLKEPLYKLQIFMDISSIEIFINDGAAVMSARIFPEKDAIGVELATQSGQCYVNLTRYDLKPLPHEEIIYQN
ncbi:GH32 C-terminal domain-containing protein [Salinicoccus halitifaciens]|uniref:beta-fructofuranosidase n=1 Tax=Salinicoccus halitifaciens TaxID=1073415 RepID=A0ABV2ECY8_9STAP|nr:GH32 C-terminal domain-containing protein [Salinicoccus halitifaciens]MCD2137327.1 glycoside hydrolase family 32 protein [Salinicoccus halitifaciens]